ncbi:MAG: hypothetical protein AAF170_12750 [Bacteroidota bacterium]
MRLCILAVLTLFAVADASAQVRSGTVGSRTATPGLRSGTPTAQETVRQPAFRLGGSTRMSVVSGSTGDRVVSLVPGGNRIPTSITIGERGDDACYLKLGYWAKPQARRARTFDSVEYDGCGSRGPTQRSLMWMTTSGFHPSTPQYGAFYGIRVGDNNRRADRRKMKGLQIYRTALDENESGTAERQPNRMKEVERTNRRQWRSAAICPSNHIIVGLDLHINDAVDSIVGIAPHCAPVTIIEGLGPAPPPEPEVPSDHPQSGR